MKICNFGVYFLGKAEKRFGKFENGNRKCEKYIRFMISETRRMC